MQRCLETKPTVCREMVLCYEFLRHCVILVLTFLDTSLCILLDCCPESPDEVMSITLSSSFSDPNLFFCESLSDPDLIWMVNDCYVPQLLCDFVALWTVICNLCNKFHCQTGFRSRDLSLLSV